MRLFYSSLFQSSSSSFASVRKFLVSKNVELLSTGGMFTQQIFVPVAIVITKSWVLEQAPQRNYELLVFLSKTYRSIQASVENMWEFFLLLLLLAVHSPFRDSVPSKCRNNTKQTVRQLSGLKNRFS